MTASGLSAKRFPRCTSLSLAILCLARPASAEPPPRLDFEAGQVTADAALTDVLLERGVSLRVDRYRLGAEKLRVRREDRALRFEGEARIALCPCPDPPLVFAARGGRFEAPGDLILTAPRVEIAGLPIFALPFLWLRAPERPGLLPPILALRSADGALLGSGVHLPWGGDASRAIDLTAAGYTSGGVQLGAELRTPSTRARALWDRVHGTRVLLEARGAIAEARGGAALAFELDALRGDRGRSATPELEPAARAFDVGALEASILTGSPIASVIAGGGVIARAARGEGAPVLGPRASLSLGGPIAALGSWSASAATAVLGGAALDQGAPLARAAAMAEIDARPGPAEVRASLSTRARFAGAIDAGEGPSREVAGAARVEASLPLVRTFAGARGEPPIAHWIAPTVSARGAVAEVEGAFFTPIAGRAPRASWIAAAGVTTAVGRYAGPALRIDARAGAAGDGHASVEPLLHARLGADGRAAAMAIEAAAVGDRVGAADAAATRGHAVMARGRVGDLLGPWLAIDAALQGGAGAGRARGIASGAWAALPGDELAHLSGGGLTFGAEISVPLSRALRAGARADLDLARGEVLAVRGLADYRHACGCLGVGLWAAHRAGRVGADVGLTVDVAPRVAR